MKFEIIVLIIAGILYIGGIFLLRKYRNNKIVNLLTFILFVLGLILAIISRIYYNDSTFANTTAIVFLSLAIVADIGKMLYKRNKQKQSK